MKYIIPPAVEADRRRILAAAERLQLVGLLEGGLKPGLPADRALC